MSYGYSYNSGMGVEEAITIFFGVFAFMLIFLGILFLAVYLFQAIGLYTMSKRRGYKNAWLAFIPFVNAYVLGGIADNINACMQKRSHHRITLLVTQIINGMVGIFSGGFLIRFVEAAIYNSYNDYYSGSDRLFIAYIFFMLLVSVASVVYSVFYYISCYKIFADYSNNNGALFLVLSILLGIAPFVIFALRNKAPISLSYRGTMGGYPQAGQPMYQQAPMQGYPQAGQPMYPQASQPMYPQAGQPPMYPQAPQQPYQAPVQPLQSQSQSFAPPPPVAPVAPLAQQDAPAQDTSEQNTDNQ